MVPKVLPNNFSKSKLKVTVYLSVDYLSTNVWSMNFLSTNVLSMSVLSMDVLLKERKSDLD